MGSIKFFRHGTVDQCGGALKSPSISIASPNAKLSQYKDHVGLANESMDSGIAGIRENHALTGSPSSGSSGSSSLHHHQQQQQQQQNPKLRSSPALQDSFRDPNELPQYIIDRSTRTTYLKGKFLGKGGFARVHEVTDLSTGKIYAGKIIPKSRITKPHHREKIAREIDLHRNLIHPHVVRFFHCFEDDDNFYIILENCSKKSLVHVMRHRKTLTDCEVRIYLRQLVDGLRYIHGQRVVHRDLKLGNMFLSENMTVKIGDFGLAARMNADAKVTICGTPNYIAPEVLSRQGHGYEADLWAVGCIMYAMMVGQPPFETASLSETYSRIAQNKYTIPSSVSRPARNLIRQLLAPDPQQRPSLERILQHEFFTSGFTPVSLPASCCYRAPNFSVSSSDLLTLEPLHLNETARKPSANRSRPELSQVQLTQPCVRVSRSQSLKEIKAKKDKDKSNREKDGHSQVSRSSFKQKLAHALGAGDKDGTSCCSNQPDLYNRNSCCSSRHNASVPAAHSLYSALDSCLYLAPTGSTNPSPVTMNHLFVSKWIDYSNKYGFGFQLSDRSIGVLFNDSTRISYTPDRSCVFFQDQQGKVSRHEAAALPSYLAERVTLLKYFSQYMDDNLTEGGDGLVDPHGRRPNPVHIKRWVRTPKAIIMQLDSNTLQINFFKDHTKIVLAADRSFSPASCLSHYTATYINSERQSSTYRLLDIAQVGCQSSLRERLVYALTVLREFAELDGDKK